MRRLRRLLAGERGYSLVEMLTVMLILGVVMGALTTLFVRASNAEVDMNKKFQAQQEARVAFDKLKRDVHCASGIDTTTASATKVTLVTPCVSGGSITWCTSGSGTRFALYRNVGTACSGSAPSIRFADFLTSGSVFSNTVQSTSSLWTLSTDFRVNARPAKSVEAYRLTGTIVLRNSTRTCVTGSPVPPC